MTDITDFMVKAVIDLASGLGLKCQQGVTLTTDQLYAIVDLARTIREDRNGLIYCGICGLGSFTKRGFYLHLTRVHKDEIRMMLAARLANQAKR